MTISVAMPIAAAPAAPALQRVRGEGRLAVKLSGGETRIDRLFQEGAAKIRLPVRPSRERLEAILINTAGGLTGGDRIAWGLDLAASTNLSATTQACEKTYRAEAGSHAEVAVRLSLGPGAALAWLPQETILFDRSALRRSIEVEMAACARLLMVEPVLFGRLAMGERVVSGTFRDRWRIRHEGRLIHAEDFTIDGDIAGALAEKAVTGGGLAAATLLLVADDAARCLDALRAAIGASGAVSVWQVGGRTPEKLLARIVAADGYDLRRALVPVIRLLAGPSGLPRIWTT